MQVLLYNGCMPSLRGYAMVFVALGLAVAGVTLALQPREQPAYTSVYEPPGKVEQRVAVVIGDSYTAGAAGVSSEKTFARVACASLEWICNYDAQGGTGYLADGKANTASFTAYAGRLAETKLQYRANVIVVTGGREDESDPAVGKASLDYFSAVQRAYPSATLVVVEPFWIDDNPPDSIVELRSAIAESAKTVGATWIDSDDWLSESDISSDGVHPTRAGHAKLGDELAQALQAAKVTAP